MATFTSFNDRLPDPTFFVNSAGAVDASGTKGPGFASENVRAIRPVQVSRTISGRGVHRETGSHVWEIDIQYHPMLREQFDVVSAFLEARNGRMYPFYVVLPQYSKPKNAAFATFTAANVMQAVGTHLAGRDNMLIDAVPNISGAPQFGDYFTITDSNDVNNTKAYKVNRVETNALYQSPGLGQPTLKQVRIHFSPPLVRDVADNSTINWINPRFRVIQKGDVIEYKLDTDNLYQFNLQLEEIQP